MINKLEIILFVIGIAVAKAVDLVQSGYWSHTNSDQCNWECRVSGFETAGLGWIGENLYYGDCDIRKAISAWEASPTHKHILNHDYRYGSILIIPKDKDRCYIIMDIAN